MTAKVRCAIYTRKSTEEGLEQAFNSLDAQREACEAYIKSQAGEGWKVLPAYYDDGGYSGGNMNRPAMQQLLSDIEAGGVDVIVVYKVDRLTRSLMDFARIVERLDARGVSFVSVTQAFNTTTSMGRLTLNVLLSFAQFEREVTGERIRDKIAASKARGMWMGGNVPLGYNLHERRLVVNPAEAEQVRHIFSRFLKLGSGIALMKELRRDGTVSKRWVSRSGQVRGGAPFSCGALYYLLQNRLYLGEIVHRGACHSGEHEAIVDHGRFEAVQQALASRRRQRRERPTRSAEYPLAGFVVDAEGRAMTTSFSYGRGGRLYRYYVAGSLDPSRPEGSQRALRVPAGPLERLVRRGVSSLLERQVSLAEALPLIAAVELHRRSIQIVIPSGKILDPHEPAEQVIERLQPLVEPDRLVTDRAFLRLIADRQPVFRGGKASDSAMAPGTESAGDAAALLRSAHRLLETQSMSPLEPSGHASATAPAFQRQRRMMMMGLLSPAIQKKILQRKRMVFDLESIKGLPLVWADQRVLIEGEV